MGAALSAWVPSAEEVRADLTYVPPEQFDYKGMEAPWQGMPLHHYSMKQIHEFDGYAWSRATALHWEVPLCAVAAYVVMIPAFKLFLKDAIEVKRFALVWNFGLALFSLAGAFYTLPIMASELWRNGFYFTVCAPAPWYGGGRHGLFVCLFIYSKFAELVDTALILLAKRRLLFLHWWHHVTVLLYCWHSYSTQIATGLWFAAMNYFVHSVMYAYYGCMGVAKLRPAAKKFAIYITLLQLAQMVVGIFVTIRAVLYQAHGADCRVNKTNSLLGLAMYASYFVLFFVFFVDTYVRAGGRKAKRA